MGWGEPCQLLTAALMNVMQKNVCLFQGFVSSAISFGGRPRMIPGSGEATLSPALHSSAILGKVPEHLWSTNMYIMHGCWFTLVTSCRHRNVQLFTLVMVSGKQMLIFHQREKTGTDLSFADAQTLKLDEEKKKKNSLDPSGSCKWRAVNWMWKAGDKERKLMRLH